MIKILFLLEELEAGGAEKVLRDLVNHMDQSLFDITVQTIWPHDPNGYLKSGIHYRSVYPQKNKMNILRYRLEAEAGAVYSLHLQNDYDIECAFLEMGPTKVMATSTNKRAKKLAWVHCDLSKKTEDTNGYAIKAAKQYQRFDEIVCVSKTVESSVLQLFGKHIHTINTKVIYNVVDDSVIKKKADTKISGVTKRKTTIVAVGRLSEEKGYDRLLCACKRLHYEGVDFDLWIVGDGPERSSLEQYCMDNGLNNCVFFLGFQENPYPFIKNADLAVCSSRYEGFSTFAMECMVLGKAFVTTECSGMREILGDSEYGLITDNTDQQFYNGFKQMVSDDSLRSYYENMATQRAIVFSRNQLVSEIEVFLERLTE